MLLSSCSASGSSPDPAPIFGGGLLKFKFVVCLIFSVCFLTISSFAADASWSTADQANLAGIHNALTKTSSGSILSFLNTLHLDVNDLDDSLGVLYSALGFRDYSGARLSDYLTSISTYVHSIDSSLGEGPTAYDTIHKQLTSMRLRLTDIGDYLDVMNDNVNVSTAILDSFNQWLRTDYSYGLGHFEDDGSFVRDYSIGPTDIRHWIGFMSMSLAFDGTMEVNGTRTLYSRIRQLQETLASDDDKALADAQKMNREEIESDFLTGSSGATSLGASDFGDLSDVGGTVKDSISLNGQASVSSFTSGLAGADESGQGWFSAATRDSLDSVSSSVSTFSMDDPYNMAGWHDRYAWVEGD